MLALLHLVGLKKNNITEHIFYFKKKKQATFSLSYKRGMKIPRIHTINRGIFMM